MADRLSVRQVASCARFLFRGGEAATAFAQGAFGVELARTPLRSASSGARHALWLGPDEWLVIAPPSDAEAIVAAFASGQEPCSLVDVSHRNLALLVEGAGARAALSSGCPLDLDAAAFPVGMCTRTIFEKAEIVLWRTGADRFHLEVWRSFAPYVEALLNEAARELAA